MVNVMAGTADLHHAWLFHPDGTRSSSSVACEWRVGDAVTEVNRKSTRPARRGVVVASDAGGSVGSADGSRIRVRFDTSFGRRADPASVADSERVASVGDIALVDAECHAPPPREDEADDDVPASRLVPIFDRRPPPADGSTPLPTLVVTPDTTSLRRLARTQPTPRDRAVEIGCSCVVKPLHLACHFAPRATRARRALTHRPHNSRHCRYGAGTVPLARSVDAAAVCARTLSSDDEAGDDARDEASAAENDVADADAASEAPTEAVVETGAIDARAVEGGPAVDRHSARVIGIDTSRECVAAARARALAGVHFERLDAIGDPDALDEVTKYVVIIVPLIPALGLDVVVCDPGALRTASKGE
jgi:hypothetical protein